MKQMSLIEMDGFLKGKCIPRDLKVNETNAEYLVRKFAEAEAKCAELADLFGDVKEIFGFKYRYFITSKGLIFSLASGELKQLNPTMRGKNRNQYLFVRLELEGKLKGVNIHRLVAENFLGPKPSDEHVINHIDGNKQNNDVSNLEWTTVAGNTQHAYRTGLAGEENTDRIKVQSALRTRKVLGMCSLTANRPSRLDLTQTQSGTLLLSHGRKYSDSILVASIPMPSFAKECGHEQHRQTRITS